MKKRLLGLICLLTLTTGVFAGELLFSRISMGRGVTHTSAISIYQDHLGQIWFGNKYLNSYSENMLQSFRLSDYFEDIEDDNIHTICGDGDRFLYFLANERLVSYDTKDGLFSNTGIDSKAICFSGESLYYSVKHKLYRFPNEEILVLPDTTQEISYILKNNSEFWIGTNASVYSYREGQINKEYSHVDVSCLFFDSFKNLWVGTVSDGVRLFYHKERRWLELKQNTAGLSICNDQIRCINDDMQGNVWIGTYKGLSVIPLPLRNVSHITYDGSSSWSLSHSSVYAICRDMQGGMWVGTYYGGLNYFNPYSNNYTYYKANDRDPASLNGYIFGKMTEDTDGNLYIATEDGGLNILNRHTNHVWHLQDPNSTGYLQTIKSVWFDKEYNRLFMGTFLNGLMWYSLQSKEIKLVESKLITDNNHRIISELIPWNNYIIALTQKGIFKLGRETLELSYLFDDDLIREKTSRIIRTIFLDQKNNLWISSLDDGIFSVNLKTGKMNYSQVLNQELKKATVNSICEDQNGMLYFLSDNKGILRWNVKTETFKYFLQETENKANSQYFRAVLTPSGRLVATFVNGISLLNPETEEIRHSFLDRISPVELSNISCGLYISPFDSRIFVGGIRGLISLSEENLDLPPLPYSLWFSSLSVNGKVITPESNPELLKQNIACTSHLELPYNKNNLKLDYSSSNYCTGDNIICYKLEGHDSQWTITGHKTITYTALPPGKYKLIVREMDESGKEIMMGITIKPPFYTSFFAIVLYTTIFIAFIWWLIRFNRSRAVLQNSLETEHREKAKIEELNQAKLRFFTNISHEIRTPLTLIKSQLDMIRRNEALSPRLKKSLHRIDAQTVHMQELITEILDFRKQEQGELPLYVSLGNFTIFLKQIVEMFSDFAESKDILYKFESSGEDIELWFDPVQMKKVFFNLLSNAFKHTPEGGRITVSLIRKTTQAEIIVSDSGPGIPEEEQRLIFDRFYQVNTQEIYSGSGIGLALAKTIVLQHHGTISVSSLQNISTDFVVTLLTGDAHFKPEQKSKYQQEIVLLPPVSLYNDIKEDTEIEDEPEDSDQKYSVLLIEDNTELLSLLEEAFSPFYRVYKANHGETGFDLALEVLPDLIVSDVMMPRMSGYELCKKLKNRVETSHIPIILLTAKASVDQVLEGLGSGADDYISKPFHMEVLLLKCKNIIRNRQDIQAKFRFANLDTPVVELATNKLDQVFLDQSIRLIEENLQNENFNIDLWSRNMAFSRSKLHKKIKSITGLTPNDFILQIKLNKSANLLINAPEYSISEIAWKCGFTTAGYFGKCFKAYYGITPKEYRNNAVK